MNTQEKLGIMIRVLALEDDRLVRKILEDTLRDECEFRAVSSNAEFQDTLVGFNPDIVLLDVLLPDGNGFEICRELRRYSQYEKLFILMLTAADQKDSIEQGYSSGANDYIRKPFIPYEVKSKILSYKKIIAFQNKLFAAFNYQLDFSKKLYLVNRIMQKNINVSDISTLFLELQLFNDILEVGHVEVIYRNAEAAMVPVFGRSYQSGFKPVSFSRIMGNYREFEEKSTAISAFRIHRPSGSQDVHCLIAPIAFSDEISGYMLLQRLWEFDSDEKNLVSLCADFASMMFRRITIQRELDSQYDRYKAEIAKVRKIQAASLPDFSRVGGYDISYTFLPAEDISGDFFDGFFLDESTYQIVLCDVSGHGMASSYVGNEIRSLFRSVSRPELSPADTLAEVNKLLFMDISEINYFGTAIVCRFDLSSGAIILASGGHPPVVFFQEHDESHSLYESTGPLIGFFEAASFRQVVLHPSPGDCMLFYTDGVTETISPVTGELFGERRLIKHFTDNATLNPQEIIQEIIGNVYEFAEFTNQADDITMICVKMLGSPYA
jgi:serine phosphatase RsbU (regulator of sigma subunit)/AmiR/NasT family two-component response regulator